MLKKNLSKSGVYKVYNKYGMEKVFGRNPESHHSQQQQQQQPKQTTIKKNNHYYYDLI